MTVYEFLETTTITDMRQSVDFIRTMELLKYSSYMENERLTYKFVTVFIVTN